MMMLSLILRQKCLFLLPGPFSQRLVSQGEEG